MNAERAIVQGQNARNGERLFVLLPKLVLALIVFAIFFIARMIERTVIKLTRDRCQVCNLGLIRGQLAQGITFLVELFMVPSIVIPSFRANDLVQ